MNRWAALSIVLCFIFLFLITDLTLHGAGPGWLDGVLQQ